MKTPTLLTAALLLATTASALPLTLPTCDLPPLDIACVRLGGIVVGDTIVGDAHGSTEAEYNNGTYVFQGTITADEGGRVEIILADIAFSGSGTPVHVLAGGTLVIDGSSLVGTPATLPSIVVEPGGTIVLRSSDFDAVTLEVRTNDADLGSTGDYSTFANAGTALRLVDFDGTMEGGVFENNTIAIEIDGGSPTLTDMSLFTNEVGIDVEDATVFLERIEVHEIADTGVRMLRSAGNMNSMALSDAAQPPTVGLDARDAIGPISLDFSHIHHLGTGIFTCDATVVENGNDLHDNGQDYATCPS